MFLMARAAHVGAVPSERQDTQSTYSRCWNLHDFFFRPTTPNQAREQESSDTTLGIQAASAIQTHIHQISLLSSFSHLRKTFYFLYSVMEIYLYIISCILSQSLTYTKNLIFLHFLNVALDIQRETWNSGNFIFLKCFAPMTDSLAFMTIASLFLLKVYLESQS